MIEFHLRDVSPSADWYAVTGGMAPDDVRYTVVTDEQEIHQQDSVTALVGLYLITREDATADVGDLAAFEGHESDGRVRLGGRVFSESVSFPGDIETLRHAVKPFLSDVFETLDSQSTQSERKEAFEFLSSTFDVDMEALYTELR